MSAFVYSGIEIVQKLSQVGGYISAQLKIVFQRTLLYQLHSDAFLFGGKVIFIDKRFFFGKLAMLRACFALKG